MTETEEQEWRERLERAVAKTLWERERRRAERREFQTRRNYGKAIYHRAKLAGTLPQDREDTP